MSLSNLIHKKVGSLEFATATVATDNPASVPSVAKVASVAVAKQETSKVVFPEDSKREERRAKVLAILTKNPDSQRAIISDLNSDSDNVILTIAIRDLATFEMQIPKSKYDAFLILEIVHKATGQ